MGRAAQAVRSVAAAAARAASVERSHAGAVAAAMAMIRPDDGDLTCAPPDVSFSGGVVETVSVRVRCEASLAGLSLLPIGGTRTFESTATEVIDAYRGG
jgi:hypothetical protein